MENIQPHDWFFKQIFSNPKSVKTVLDIFATDLAEEVVGGDEKNDDFNRKMENGRLDKRKNGRKIGR
jgi:hypothetical protein